MIRIGKVIGPQPVANGRATRQTDHADGGSDATRSVRTGRAVRILGGSVGIAVLLAGAVIVLFVAVFPTSELLAQRRDLASAKAELADARSTVAELEEHLDAFDDRTSVTRIARERFSLVMEGERLYRLSTHAGAAANLPDAWLWPGFARLVRGD